MASPGFQSRLLRLCQKELKETIRDRRTIITLLLMPLLVYPLLSMALNRFLLTSGIEGSKEGVTLVIGVEDADQQSILRQWIDHPMGAPPEAILELSGGRVAQFEVRVTEEDPVEALHNNKIDLAARIAASQPSRFTLIAYDGDGTSQDCQRILTERFHWFRMRVAEANLERALGTYEVPSVVELQTVGEPQQKSMLATIIPLVLVLMTITGAVYPAIDLTAGERERGTMESLMASPVPRFYVLFAKYTAVVTVALLTAIANLLAMFTTLWAGGLLEMITGTSSFPWIAVLQILGLLLLFSGFFSAVLLSLTSFAKSFKEAQAYLIPVMLFSLAPAMFSAVPGIKLSGILAVVPLVNIVLLARDLLAGSAEAAPAFVAIASTVAYAAAALGVAAKLFGSDAVTRTSQQSIGSLFRRPEKWSLQPSPASAAMVLALLVPVYFVCSSVLMRVLKARNDMMLGDQEALTDQQSVQMQSLSMVASAVVLIVVFGLIPLAAAYFGRNRYQSTYRLYAPKPMALVGALIAGLGAWAIAYELTVVTSALGIGGLEIDRLDQTKRVLELWKQIPSWLLLATLALTPAVIEELCFRGFLFSSLAKVLSPGRTIVITAALFGLFHVLTGGTLLIERFVPSTALGLVLGWMAYRTGSVIPGIVMHFVHNGLLELVGQYKDELAFLGDSVTSDKHLPYSWTITATCIAVTGLIVIFFATRPTETTAELAPSSVV